VEDSGGEGIGEEGSEGDAAIVRGDHVGRLVEAGLEDVLQTNAERAVEDADATSDDGAGIGTVREADARHELRLRRVVKGTGFSTDSGEGESAGR